jgi:uncharacterized protein (TIGR02145 family)
MNIHNFTFHPNYRRFKMRIQLTKITLAAGFALALALTFISCANEDNGGGGNNNGGGGSCDIKDYRTVTIGDQTWMAENLRCNVSGSKCYEDSTSYCNRYGRLYDWSTAMALPSKCNTTHSTNDADCDIDTPHQGICPSGWHIPSEEEWGQLIDYVEQQCRDLYCVGGHLRAKGGWGYDNEDTYGFSALPGGYGYSGGSFSGGGRYGIWWGTDYYYQTIGYCNGDVCGYHYHPNINNHSSYLYSVRCLRD